MRKAVIAALLIIVVVGGLFMVERSVRLNRPMPKTASQGKNLPLPADLKIKSIASQEAVPLKAFAGKVVLINFWASWCEACVTEMPSIERLYRTLKPEGFEVIGMNVDENPQKVVPAIVSKLGLSFSMYTDIDEQLTKVFDVAAIPFSAILDRQGKVVWSESGERDWASDAVINEIRGILKPPEK